VNARQLVGRDAVAVGSRHRHDQGRFAFIFDCARRRRAESARELFACASGKRHRDVDGAIVCAIAVRDRTRETGGPKPSRSVHGLRLLRPPSRSEVLSIS